MAVHSHFQEQMGTGQGQIHKEKHDSLRAKVMSMATGRGDNQSVNSKQSADMNLNKTLGKIGPVAVFRPKHLTFNFVDSGYRPRDPRRLSLGGKGCSDPSRPITHSTVLDFVDFVDLFKSFSVRSRKDLKDLFEQFATVKPGVERRMPKDLLHMLPPSKYSGVS